MPARPIPDRNYALLVGGEGDSCASCVVGCAGVDVYRHKVFLQMVGAMWYKNKRSSRKREPFPAYAWLASCVM